MTKTFSYLDTYKNRNTGQIFIVLGNIKDEKYRHTEESFFGCKMYVKALEKTELKLYCIDMLDEAYVKIEDKDAEVICTKYRMLNNLQIEQNIVLNCSDAYDIRDLGIGHTVIVYDALTAVLVQVGYAVVPDNKFHNITFLRRDSQECYTFIIGVIKEFSTEYVVLNEITISLTETYSSLTYTYLQYLLKNHYYLVAKESKNGIKLIKPEFVLNLASQVYVTAMFRDIMNKLIKENDIGALCLICLKKLTKEEIKEYLYFYLNHNRKFKREIWYLSCNLLYNNQAITVTLKEYTKEIFDNTVNKMYREIVKIFGRTGKKKSIKKCADKLKLFYLMPARTSILEELDTNALERERRLKNLVSYC